MALNESTDIKQLRKFDVDLEFGQTWEKHIDDLFSGVKTCEVKTERDKWQQTGNICIETECYGKPSGLSKTEADVWAHNLVKDDEVVCTLLFNTNKLKEMMEEMKPRTVYGGDNKASKLFLVGLRDLINQLLK